MPSCRCAATARSRKPPTAIDSSRAAALKGPLHGVPFTIKDSFDTEGVVTTIGSEGRKEFVPNKDATVVARVRAPAAFCSARPTRPSSR